MAIKFQYNKTSLGDLGKQLKMRQKALPTIKSKESALRSEVKKAKEAAQEFRSQLSRLEAEYDYMVSLWGEFDCDLLRIADIELTEQKIAGVRTPVLREIVYEEKPYDLFSSPVWYAAGIDLLKRLSKLGIEYELFNRKMELLDFARRKTTQKVNLYEKVQIPGYEDAIRKIDVYKRQVQRPVIDRAQPLIEIDPAGQPFAQGCQTAVDGAEVGHCAEISDRQHF